MDLAAFDKILQLCPHLWLYQGFHLHWHLELPQQRPRYLQVKALGWQHNLQAGPRRVHNYLLRLVIGYPSTCGSSLTPVEIPVLLCLLHHESSLIYFTTLMHALHLVRLLDPFD